MKDPYVILFLVILILGGFSAAFIYEIEMVIRTVDAIRDWTTFNRSEFK